ncbi:SDR family oxidoreductase [Notoacmeibacter sp. MSK16QG-6]|uniref:SDR family NAD(P)-dependent oxidoreductase n=1 Tax=Notoacmeibacter sp. MSK16QG-6 TaxID=2957982 RepID=UPI0020A2000B|nr:SDR family oxidoreductase [Notoacmeibacter sp. MSK16QG-6]
MTGGASGIGLATARRFAGQGERVVVIDLDESRAQSAAQALGGTGNHAGYCCDVTDAAAVEVIFDSVGEIDVLVNSAGIGDVNIASVDQSIDRFRRVLDIHLSGAFLLAQHAARSMMMHKRGGKIVNLTSIAALGGLPRRNAYGAAKAGIVAMTRSLACEWASAGICVNAVAPGYVRTELVEGLIRDGLIDGDQIVRRTPAGRFVTPEEIADAIVFLASDAASAITGVTLPVDCGWTAYGAAGDAFSTEAANN